MISGTVAGSFSPTSFPWNGFYYSNGSYVAFGPQQIDGQAGTGVFPMSINNRGDIVGQWIGDYTDKGNPEEAFIYTDGHYSRFKYPGQGWTAACGINNKGQIVGTYNKTIYTSCGAWEYPGNHGFLLSDGTYSTIHCPSANLRHSAA